MPAIPVRYGRVLEIVGDLLKVHVPPAGSDTAEPPACLGDLAAIASADDGAGTESLAQVLKIDGERVSLQVFAGTKGISTRTKVRFLGHGPRAICSENVLGRIFAGTGELIDNGPALTTDREVEIGSPTVNPVERELGARMIRTNVPMIDVFNTLVESQKIPIFSVAGEPYNQLLGRIGIQADADVVVFGGLGLIYDDYHHFRRAFEDAGVFARTAMFVNFASDPIVERLLVPDMALAVAERFAVEGNKRVLVLLSDMTAFADALKEVGIAMEQVPANRGYTGDLYTQLAQRYEKACNFAGGGSLTILSATTMPGDDVTHPVPDNTGYITEGQFYLREGMIDPFGSLSRLKQHVASKTTREDHKDIMNVMVRLYADSKEAEQKQAMAFELSEHDEQALTFGRLFRERFMDLDVDMTLEAALDLCWQTLAECFRPEQLFMKQQLIDRYYPTETGAGEAAEREGTRVADAAQ
ncbi:V/A-type H+-transporting ATPase subunit B [Limimonas halophila]|uniref:V/A-type H+-transporting ATPase subunit B n=1 Tax=Limimonas halophila TaxID=1082479 RepID=A0A1G7UB45_9PROT|nr:V-type ATP synthase subunit B [Limimonas halophila]SDG44805.1 V/A-type H+-transporting ATPase subunit B [Limimonas halophila]